jgi:hypothetical protein
MDYMVAGGGILIRISDDFCEGNGECVSIQHTHTHTHMTATGLAWNVNTFD